MDEKSDISLDISSKSEKNSVGGTIRKQRISMNISIEKISRDLKINKIYVQAVEDDDHESIPAAPYVRVYVKTIAEYLSLDSEKLLRQLSEDKGKKTSFLGNSGDSMPIPEKKEGGTLNVSLSKNKKSGSFGLTILLVVLLIVLAYFVVNQKMEQSGEEQPRPDEIDSIETMHEEQPLDNIEEEPEEDSLLVFLSANPVDADNPPAVEVRFQASDSSWIDVVADGIVLDGKVFNASEEKFAVLANDSIILRVVIPRAIEIVFNGEVVDKGSSVPSILRFTKDDMKIMTVGEWSRARKIRR
jgi:hypothetical protein